MFLYFGASDFTSKVNFCGNIATYIFYFIQSIYLLKYGAVQVLYLIEYRAIGDIYLEKVIGMFLK